jgi:hypothetical protein
MYVSYAVIDYIHPFGRGTTLQELNPLVQRPTSYLFCCLGCCSEYENQLQRASVPKICQVLRRCCRNFERERERGALYCEPSGTMSMSTCYGKTAYACRFQKEKCPQFYGLGYDTMSAAFWHALFSCDSYVSLVDCGVSIGGCISNAPV